MFRPEAPMRGPTSMGPALRTLTEALEAIERMMDLVKGASERNLPPAVRIWYTHPSPARIARVRELAGQLWQLVPTGAPGAVPPAPGAPEQQVLSRGVAESIMAMLEPASTARIMVLRTPISDPETFQDAISRALSALSHLVLIGPMRTVAQQVIHTLVTIRGKVTSDGRYIMLPPSQVVSAFRVSHSMLMTLIGIARLQDIQLTQARPSEGTLPG